MQYNNESVLHTSLLQQTIQGKRAREESSPNEDDVKKRRKPLVNNEITSSLSSSLSIKPPHLKSTKRKAPDIDDSVSTTPTLGKQLKIQTEVTPPLPRTQSTSISEPPTTSKKNEVQQNSLNDTPKNVSLEKIKTPLVTEEPRISPPATTSLSEKEDDQVVSRLLGRMSTPVDESYHIEVPEKKNVFMSTNDLSLSPPKENRLAAMIAVLGGPSENLEGESSHPGVPTPQERNLTAKALFTSPPTPDTPKQQKKVTFSETLSETKIYDRDKCASPLDGGMTTDKSNKEPNMSNVKPLSLNFGLSAFSPPATESVKQSLESNKSAHSQVSSTSTLVTQPLSQQSTTMVNSFALTSSPAPKFTMSAGSFQPENIKLPTFNFGSVTTGQTNQESPDQPATNSSPNPKPFSFGSESKTSIESTGITSPSLFGNKTLENGATKPVTTPLTSKTKEQSKQNFNLFSDQNSGKNEQIKNQLVNGLTPTSATKSAQPLFNIPVSQDSSNKSFSQSFSTLSNSSVQSPPTFSFGLPSSTTTSASTTVSQPVVSTTFTSQTVPNLFTSGSNQPSQSTNLFNNPSNSLLESNPFSKGINMSQSSTVGSPGQSSNLFNKNAGSAQTCASSQGSSVFGNSSFGTIVKDSKVTQNITSTPQTSSLFGTPQLTVGSGTSSQSSNQSGGFSFPTTSSQVTPFGVPSTTITSSATSVFGNASTTTQPSVMFGSVTSTCTEAQVSSLFSTSSGNSTQPSIFSASGNNQMSKSLFSSSTSSSPFGIQTKDSVQGFGNQNSITSVSNQNSTPVIFGSQTTSNFGNQQNTNTFGFGNPNSLNTPQNVFNSTGIMAQGTSNSSTEVKTPSFNPTSAFMFGSSSTDTSKESAKPFGTAMPFSFGSNAQQPTQSLPNPVQSSLPTFGNSSTGFSSGQQIPVFCSGLSQPAAPTFNFGQQASPAPTFQFNATTPTPQPPQGGMFSIGSGGSSAVRSKAAALRRRHKQT